MNIGRNDIDWRNLSHDEIDRIIAERIEADDRRIEASGGKKPKRVGYILERIAEINNLREADREAQDGKVKKNRFIRRHNLHPEEDLRALQLMILTLDFPAPDYSVMKVRSDAGKVRDIVKQKYFPWRILHHAIMRVIEEDVYRNLIYDTSACIKGKGLHFGVRRMKRFLHRYPEYKWFVKTDFKKFYQSILHELIVAALRRKFKDERFIKLIEIAVLSYDSGTELVDVLENEVERKKGRTKDGKKFFDVKETRLMDILNVPITVVDFETNVKTKQGEGRYCVLFEQNGQRSKFITNCYNLKDVLDQAREAENNGQKIFPVENEIVKRRSLGDGKSAYYFEE